jgi:dTMP kinase
MYICLEGIDGSGKSTQIRLLENWLKELGYPVLRVFEPTRSPIGLLIKDLLQNPAVTDDNFQQTLALLFAADRMMLMEEIKDAKSVDKIILSDRSFYSSLVYQNDREWVSELNKYIVKPDMVILLDLDSENAFKRCENKDHFENKVFLAKIRGRYLKLAESSEFFIVNTNNGINKIHEDIKHIIAPKLGICI